MAAKLRIHTVTGEKYEVPIQNTATIGRTSDNTVCLNTSAHISRQHAIIRCHNGYEYQIMDLGSRNGTYVNDQRVVLPVTLVNGAKIRIANNEILFEQEAEHGGEDAIEATLAASTDQHAQSVRPAAILVCDIRGFSTQSEKIPAEGLSQILGQWFREAGNVVQRSGGIIDKFIGDAVMAFWCAPFSPGESHAAAACRSALAQQEAIGRLNQDLPNILGLRRSALTIAVRIGIATGEVVLGTIGSKMSKSFTVIGDTVNLASRLESVNKVFGTRIILTESTVKLAGSEVNTRELDLITVAGKTEPVRIYELLGPADRSGPGEVELPQEFAKGLAAYRERQWDTAERQFRRCLELSPTDGPSALYLERIAGCGRNRRPTTGTASGASPTSSGANWELFGRKQP